MSLIIDALKKTQQLRLNGSEGSPSLRYPSPGLTKKRDSKKQWIAVCTGLIGLSALLLVFLRPASSPLATQTSRTIVPIETKYPAAAPKKEDPTEGLRTVGAALSGRPSSAPDAEKISGEPLKEVLTSPKGKEHLSADTAPSPRDAGAGSAQIGSKRPPSKPVALGSRPSLSKVEKVASTRNVSLNENEDGSAVKQAPPPLTPVAQKEEDPLKSIAVEQEGEKDHKIASEVLNHFNSGVTFYNQKQFSKAIQAYQKAIALDSTYVEAYNNLGIAYQAAGDTKSAIGAYQKSTEINPRYEKGYNNLGLLFLLEGRHGEALEVFQKTLAINPNHIESRINLGILFKQKGQWQDAIESYQKALAIDPYHREAHYNIALLYEQLENWELAMTHYQQFIQLSSKSYPELVVRVKRRLNALMKTRENK